MPMLTCKSCGELFMYRGYWNIELGNLECANCQGLDEMAEEASYRGEEEDEEG